MGSRDFRKREAKKPKKTAIKPQAPITLRPLPEVEVVARRKKRPEEEPQE